MSLKSLFNPASFGTETPRSSYFLKISDSLIVSLKTNAAVRKSDNVL
jgi:hypothetical protein